MTKREFIDQMLALATDARRRGRPIVPQAAAGQAALESTYGTSELAARYFNLFGVKATRTWRGPVIEMPTLELVDGKLTRVMQPFRVYPSWAASIDSYGAIVEGTKWFQDAAAAARRGDATGYVYGLCATPTEYGWAPVAEYGARIVNVMMDWPQLACAFAEDPRQR